MDTLAAWAKRAGWYQMGKASFWKNSAYDEFAGLMDGYFCMTRDSRGRIHLRIHFLQDDRITSKVILARMKLRKDVPGIRWVVVNQHGLTLSFGGYFQSRAHKVKNCMHALDVLVPLLRSMGARPSAVCECGRQDQLKCFKESDGALHFRCPACAGKADAK